MAPPRMNERNYIRRLCNSNIPAKIKAFSKHLDSTKAGYLVSFCKKLRNKLKNSKNAALQRGLNAYKKKLGWLAKRKLDRKTKDLVRRKFKTQRGGFWNMLLSALVPIAFDLIYDKLVKNK
jgi:hypothetical protein